METSDLSLVKAEKVLRILRAVLPENGDPQLWLDGGLDHPFYRFSLGLDLPTTELEVGTKIVIHFYPNFAQHVGVARHWTAGVRLL